jgi:hypothetical protein
MISQCIKLYLINEAFEWHREKLGRWEIFFDACAAPPLTATTSALHTLRR